jgi:hypothetical protein
MAELHLCYPLIPSDISVKVKRLNKSENEMNRRTEKERNKMEWINTPIAAPPAPESASAPPPYRHSFGQELPDFSRCQDVHHHSVVLFCATMLSDPQVSASAYSAVHCLSYCLPQCLLLVTLPAAVVEEVIPRRGRRLASAAVPPPAFVFLSVAEPF